MHAIAAWYRVCVAAVYWIIHVFHVITTSEVSKVNVFRLEQIQTIEEWHFNNEDLVYITKLDSKPMTMRFLYVHS